MMQRLEESKNMEAEERARLEEEIRIKQEEVSTIYQQVCTPELIYHFLVASYHVITESQII